MGAKFLEASSAETKKRSGQVPQSLRASDADWLMPLGVAAAGMFATDTELQQASLEFPESD